MNKIRILLVVFCFGVLFSSFLPNVLAAETECESGDRKCVGDYKYVCNSSYKWGNGVNCIYGCSGGYCNECTTTSYPQACSSGTLTYCLGGDKKSVACTYGCRNSTTCAQCSSDSNCLSTQACIGGVCKVPTCSEVGGFCINTAGYNNSPYKCPSVSTKGKCDDPNNGTCCTAKCLTDYATAYGALCLNRDYCSAVGGYNTFGGAIVGCANGLYCCVDSNAATFRDICNSNQKCVDDYGDCYTCDDVPINESSYTYKDCKKHVSTGGDGSCGSAAGGDLCSMPTSGLCSSSYGSTPIDSVGTDGTFDWKCVGQKASTCRTVGKDSSACTATKKLFFEGVCGTSNGSNVVSRPSDNLCITGTTDWSITGTDSEGTDGTFDWKCVGSCGGKTETCTAINDTAPNLNSTVLQTSGGSTVAVESGNRNHICQLAFGGNSTVRWVITGSDVQGVSDISTVTLRFRTNAGAIISTSAVAAVNGVATFVVDTSGMTAAIYNVEVQINDVHTSPGNRGWIDTGRDFKVWDCLVGVTGTIYDGSDTAISCSGGAGYTNTVSSDLSFGLRYGIGAGNPRIMTVNSPTFASGDKLYWNSTVNYQPVFVVFPGSSPNEARINGNCISGASLDPKLADAYATTPILNIEYASVMDQEAWYQTVGGSILATGKVTNYVPVTCKDNCQTVAGGIIFAKEISVSDKDVANSSDGSLNSGKTIKARYSYADLKKQYFTNKGVGTTFVGNQNRSANGIKDATGVIFVQGNMTIDTDIDTSDFIMIIASGDIIINEDVNKINAILVGSNVLAGGSADNQLVINGVVYGVNGVKFNRTFAVASKNNTAPSIKVVYNPGLLFMVPKEIIKSLSQWKVN